MQIEVELKAHVADPLLLLSQLRSSPFAATESPIDRNDTYLYNTSLAHTVRLREEGTSLVVTTKERALERGIEINSEAEFSCDATQTKAVIAFFSSLGYCVVLTKRKAGFSYTCTPKEGLPALTIELCEVLPLGWFIELEYLLPNEELVPLAKRGLQEALARLGVDYSAIESRPYMVLLSQAGREEHPPPRGSER